ncbi:Vacuolar sorting protein 9 domain isoform 3 [Hibiscus syriacus]|uniref:Vacuolar sorting protein 9 domain isoform 3 n=1 Tax=Hibiscus syriacus TaxID=106335 RepID=A0A6A2YCV0_HIBSY|nr:Vacuolar sorting protein 9 domain isoform 3 [Hibiscus syriacus]
METTQFDSFLDRMRNPASLNFVRSIKSFIVSFSFNAPNPENDSKRIQDFLLSMEAAMRDHPLWEASSDAEIDNALEGLEKYVMTKLHSRTFASSAEDVQVDAEISDKIYLLQTFLRPQHLDIPPVLQNEASWLIGSFQSLDPWLVLEAREDRVLGGADDFLPVLIYVTIKASSPCSSFRGRLAEHGKTTEVCIVSLNTDSGVDISENFANPPHLHSNLKFIQIYRMQSKLVSEEAYFLTNLVSAKSFIVDLNAKSLSIEESEFEESMQAARLVDRVPQETLITFDKRSTLKNITDPGELNYPYMEVEAGELTVGDVERLLSLYKDVVSKYTSLCSTVRHLTVSKMVSPVPQGNDEDLLTGSNGTHKDTSCQGD